jgi:hypothetical protein
MGARPKISPRPIPLCLNQSLSNTPYVAGLVSYESICVISHPAGDSSIANRTAGRLVSNFLYARER